MTELRNPPGSQSFLTLGDPHSSPVPGLTCLGEARERCSWDILPLEMTFKMIHWGCPVECKDTDVFNNTPLLQNIPQKFTVSY